MPLPLIRSYEPSYLKMQNHVNSRIFLLSIIFSSFFPISSYPEAFDSWRLEPFGHQILPEKVSGFGGLSGISVSSSGKKFVMISDKAMYFMGEMIRNSTGKLIDIRIRDHGKILNSKGEQLSGKNTDSESIVRSPGDGYYISFESNSRIMFHENFTSPGEFLPKHPDFKRLMFNDGIEALAVNNSGQLYAIPESPPKGDRDHPIYKLKEDKWIVISNIKITEDFKITDAEFIDDRNLILLERKFTFLDGFQTRVKRILFEKDEIKSIQVLLESGPWEFYNLEGLSKWKDEYGNTYLTMISDNQFSPLLKTEIREFLLVR